VNLADPVVPIFYQEIGNMMGCWWITCISIKILICETIEGYEVRTIGSSIDLAGYHEVIA
jgi:ABC-type uncharacterized transport system permease subunit